MVAVFLPYHIKSLFSQVLRSSDLWSAGIMETEQSIHDAYIKSIEKAKHYIYIEV